MDKSPQKDEPMPMESLGELLDQYQAIGEKIYGKGYMERSSHRQGEVENALHVRADESMHDAVLRVCATLSEQSLAYASMLTDLDQVASDRDRAQARVAELEAQNAELIKMVAEARSETSDKAMRRFICRDCGTPLEITSVRCGDCIAADQQ